MDEGPRGRGRYEGSMKHVVKAAGALAFALSSLSVAPVYAANHQCGIASWYGPGFHGRTAASGERFDQNALTAAHRTLPFGTVVEVTRADNGDSVRVRITDRGPYAGGRIIDLSRGAAAAIDMIAAGVVPVRITVVGGNANLPGGCST